MLTLNDGRSELWQWDTCRTLAVDADCSQVHFSNKVFGRSLDVDVIGGVANIPDILLQTDKDLTAWAFVGTPENGYTKISKVFKVNRRNKPADYVFTPTEQTTLGEILERLDDIESAQDPDAIKNAVEDYLDNNPIQIEETDPTVPAWAKQPQKPTYTAEEVGALPDDTAIPAPYVLPVANADTLGGVKPVAATADMTQPVGVDAAGALFTILCSSGGGSSDFEVIGDLTTEEVVQTVEFPYENSDCTEIIVLVVPSASFKPTNAWFRCNEEYGRVFNFAHINTITVGTNGIFVVAKIAKNKVFSTLHLMGDYMWNSNIQYSFHYNRERQTDFTKVVLDFLTDVPSGTVIKVFAR